MEHHESFAAGHSATRASSRSFGCLFAFVFAVIGIWPLLQLETPRVWALGAAALIGAIAMARPAWLEAPNRVWMALGVALGNVVGAIVMAFLFFAVVTPVALAMRLARRDPLRLARDPEARTYWIDRDPPGPPPESMRNQF